MAQYRKKLVVIEAEQFWPDRKPWPAGVRETVVTTGTAEDGDLKTARRYVVVTIHGREAEVDAGDWILPEPDGVHHYPCDPAVFEATYDRLPDCPDCLDVGVVAVERRLGEIEDAPCPRGCERVAPASRRASEERRERSAP